VVNPVDGNSNTPKSLLGKGVSQTGKGEFTSYFNEVNNRRPEVTAVSMHELTAKSFERIMALDPRLPDDRYYGQVAALAQAHDNLVFGGKNNYGRSPDGKPS
jgi:hypothetical protein